MRDDAAALPVLTPSHDALNIALLALEGVLERQGARFVREWPGSAWLANRVLPDAVDRLEVMRRRLREEQPS